MVATEVDKLKLKKWFSISLVVAFMMMTSQLAYAEKLCEQNNELLKKSSLSFASFKTFPYNGIAYYNEWKRRQDMCMKAVMTKYRLNKQTKSDKRLYITPSSNGYKQVVTT